MSEAPTAPDTPRRSSRPARVLGAVSAVLALAAVALVVLGAIGLASVATPNMQGFNPGASVTVGDRGMSVYARSDDDRASTVCTMDDGSPTTLARPTSEFAVDVSGSDFYEVARTPEDLVAGSYALTCEGTAQALYVGPAAPNTAASGLMGPAGLIGGILLGLLAVVVLVVSVIISLAGRGKQAGDSPHPYQSYPTHGYPPAPGGGTHNPYGPPPPPSGGYGQEQGYGQTEAMPQQDSSGQGRIPPPPPSWNQSSSEPTQAIAYGQGHFDAPTDGRDPAPDDEPSHDDDEDPPTTYPPPPPPQ